MMGFAFRVIIYTLESISMKISIGLFGRRWKYSQLS